MEATVEEVFFFFFFFWTCDPRRGTPPAGVTLG